MRNHVTISTIGPLLYKLLSQKLPENLSDKHVAKTLKRATLADLKDRYDSKEELLNKACLLDPRCKAMSFLSQTEQKSIINKAIEEALEIAGMSEQFRPLPEADDQSQSPDDSPPTKKSPMTLIEDVITSNPVSNSTASDITQIKEDIDKEINNYLCLGVERSENPGGKIVNDIFPTYPILLRNISASQLRPFVRKGPV